MKWDSNSEYNNSLRKRLRKIIDDLDLEISGFSILTGKSESHIYGILNGTRAFSRSFGQVIGKIIGVDSDKIFNLNTNIPSSFQNENLINFRIKYKENPEYFKSNKNIRSVDKFVRNLINNSKLFDKEVSVNEVRKYCRESLDRDFSSDKLSKALTYLVKKGVLKVSKKIITKKNGQIGVRKVDYFQK